MLDGKVSTRDAVFQELKNRIATGQWKAGSRLPSERALAQDLAVSRASVQNALDMLESAGMLVRQPNCRPIVLSEPASIHHKLPKLARQVAVWIHPSLQDLGAAMMLQGIRAAIGAHGFQLLVGCTPSLELETVHRSEAQFLRSLVDNRVIAGAIVWDTGSPVFGATYQALGEAGIPVVFIDREPTAAVNADLVATNHRRAARAAVQHLIELGHRHIAMVVNDDPASSVLDRIDGYRSALREAEIPFRAEEVVRLPVGAGQSGVPEHEPAIVELLKGPNPPTAIFAVNDQIALYVQQVAGHEGIRIPEDLSLVGFDWLMRWLPSGGDLTTVAQPFEEIGRVAAERLLHRIENDLASIPRQILLDAPVVIRKTTAAPRAVPVRS